MKTKNTKNSLRDELDSELLKKLSFRMIYEIAEEIVKYFETNYWSVSGYVILKKAVKRSPSDFNLVLKYMIACGDIKQIPGKVGGKNAVRTQYLMNVKKFNYYTNQSYIVCFLKNIEKIKLLPKNKYHIKMIGVHILASVLKKYRDNNIPITAVDNDSTLLSVTLSLQHKEQIEYLWELLRVLTLLDSKQFFATMVNHRSLYNFDVKSDIIEFIESKILSDKKETKKIFDMFKKHMKNNGY